MGSVAVVTPGTQPPDGPDPDVPTISHDEAIDEFPDYLAQELSGHRLRFFVRHLRDCENCYEKLLTLEFTSTSPRPMRPAPPPVEAPARATDRAMNSWNAVPPVHGAFDPLRGVSPVHPRRS